MQGLTLLAHKEVMYLLQHELSTKMLPNFQYQFVLIDICYLVMVLILLLLPLLSYHHFLYTYTNLLHFLDNRNDLHNDD